MVKHEPTERTPAQQRQAAAVQDEMALLGAMLLSDRVAAEAVALLRPEHLERPCHVALFRLLAARVAAGQTCDMVEVTAALMADGSASAVGGASYLAELPDYAPGVHIALTGPPEHPGITERIRSRASRRRLLEIGEALRDVGLGGRGLVGHDYLPDDPVGAAALAARMLAHLGTPDERTEFGIGESLDRARERRRLERESGRARAIATGLPNLDAVLDGGLRPGQLVVVAGRPGQGKAQPLDAGVLTPGGFVPMGSIRVGDRVIGADGQPKKVMGVFPQGRKAVYRVRTTDGAETRSCGEHLWQTQTRNERRRGVAGSVKSLDEIRSTLTRNGTSPNHAIPVVAPVEFEPVGDLRLDPYLLGLLIGDGALGRSSILFYKPEPDLVAALRDRLPPGDITTEIPGGVRIRKKSSGSDVSATTAAIRVMGLNKSSLEKHVPPEYMRASPEDRLALLRGLFDTDGSVVGGGALVEFSTSSPRLAADVRDLALSLGATVSSASRHTQYTHLGEKRTGARSWRLRVSFQDGTVPVSSSKHLARWKGAAAASRYRSISEVVPDGEAECQCISVEGGLYVTDGYIVTHNTSIALAMACHAAESERRVGFVSLEMDGEELSDRVLSRTIPVPLGIVRRGDLDDDPTTEEWREYIRSWPFRTSCVPGITPAGLAAQARQWSARGLDLLVVDYLQRIRHDGAERHDIAVGRTSTLCKELAMSLKVPVVLLSQLNRDVERRQTPRKKGEDRDWWEWCALPKASDLKDSGDIEQDADIILFPVRGHEIDTTIPDDEAVVVVEKHRNGRTGIARVRWDGPTASYREME